MKKIILLALLFYISSSHVQAQSLYFPPFTGTTWDTLSPSSIGYCAPRIDSLYAYLQAKNSKSFIVLKDGKIVLEKYFGTYTQDSLWYWASASKSLASFITGVAQQKGYININNKVSQYIGNGWTNAPLVKENLITVKNLIEMTSGLDDAPAGPCYNEDTAKACLIYKVDAGNRWAYHTGAYRKVQDVVSTAVGLSYNAVTNNWIKSKIGMSGTWSKQVYYSRARDMARFGLLNLNKGIWKTDTLLKDTAYFKAMTNSSQAFNEAYGYLWWLNGKGTCMAPQSQIVFNTTLMSNAPADMYCALGKNDQKIYVVPSQNIVIVRQGNSAGGFSLASSAFDNTLWDYINKLSCTNSINTISEAQTIRVYPNPSAGIVMIYSAINETAVIYNYIGEKVMQLQLIKGENTLDVAHLTNGIYVIKTNTTSTKFSVSK
ncbi:MAG: serine hydrolase [Bacteroidia bacterium]|nr:serine hydrolase [Bacteroidia bacterium]